MACDRVFVLVAMALLGSQMASSLPAERDREVMSPFGGAGRQVDADESFGFNQAYNKELLSLIQCNDVTNPSTNHMFVYRTEIKKKYGQYYVCLAHFKEVKNIEPELQAGMISTPEYPAVRKYGNNRLYLYNLACESDQVLVIDEISIDLQDKIPFEGVGYCVDYVEIDPPIAGHPDRYCENQNFSGPYPFSGTDEVKVAFRTSQKDNNHSGFKIDFRCEDQSQTEENLLLKYLQIPPFSSLDLQRTDDDYEMPEDPLTELVSFASQQCKQATGQLSVSLHWDIVQLALQSENSQKLEILLAAEEVLRCFPPEEIALARIGIQKPQN